MGQCKISSCMWNWTNYMDSSRPKCGKRIENVCCEAHRGSIVFFAAFSTNIIVLWNFATNKKIGNGWHMKKWFLKIVFNCFFILFFTRTRMSLGSEQHLSTSTFNQEPHVNFIERHCFLVNMLAIFSLYFSSA